MNKINLGAGSDVRAGNINHDITPLKNIDVVHELNHAFWPFKSNSVKEILTLDILKHLNDFTKSMEEIDRIIESNGKCTIKVPYWNSTSAYIDPTHKRGFHELTFSFFDPSESYCKLRLYYTKARFYISSEIFFLSLFQPYFSIPFYSNIRIKNEILKKIIGFIGNTFNNIILDLKIELTKVK